MYHSIVGAAPANVRVFAAACALALACAPTSPPIARWPENRAALAKPEPDPACRATVQEALGRNGLERVVLKLAVDGRGRAEIVEVLAPDLTPAAKVDLQRAVASCAWAPVPSDGGTEVWTTRWVRDRTAR